MSPTPPDNPFSLVTPAEHPPAARRELSVFGAPAELILVPERKHRTGVPTAARPPFCRSVVERILREETVCSSHGWALTPNRYPLAKRELLLWALEPVRELPAELLEIAFLMEEREGATVLANTMGSAASIPRAHVHVLDDRLPFLGALRREPFQPDYLEVAADVEVLRLVDPYPVLMLGVKGPAAPRAAAIHQLLLERITASFNVISQDGVSWVFPRRGNEIPEPHFGFALGAAEIWGRWFFPEEEPFRAATANDLEQAIAHVGFSG